MIAIAADWATLLAFVIALGSIISAVLSREKVKFIISEDPDIASVSFSQLGSSPARNVAYRWGTYSLTSQEGQGDGQFVVLAMAQGQSFTASFQREGQAFHNQKPDPEKELRISVSGKTDRYYFEISWQSSVMPWHRRRLKFVGESSGIAGWSDSLMTLERTKAAWNWPPA